MAVTLTFNGETHTIAEWARRQGLSTQALWSRYQAGWSDARALTTPLRHRRPKPDIAPSPFAPHIAGPAILLGGRWVPAQLWIAALERQGS
jgi:hypothetical protein